MEKRTQRVRRSFTPESSCACTPGEGRAIPAIARDLDLTETAMRSWVRKTEIDTGTRDGLTSEERAELAHLRREVRVLRVERDLLKRAHSFYVESGVMWTGLVAARWLRAWLGELVRIITGLRGSQGGAKDRDRSPACAATGVPHTAEGQDL